MTTGIVILDENGVPYVRMFLYNLYSFVIILFKCIPSLPLLNILHCANTSV
jgi:hypothetical protein